MIYYVSIKETKGIDMEQKIVGNRIKELMKKNKDAGIDWYHEM